MVANDRLNRLQTDSRVSFMFNTAVVLATKQVLSDRLFRGKNLGAKRALVSDNYPAKWSMPTVCTSKMTNKCLEITETPATQVAIVACRRANRLLAYGTILH